MNPAQPINTIRREYRFKAWIRAIYLLLGLGMTFGFCFAAEQLIVDTNSAGPAAIMLPFSAIGLYFLAFALRSRLVIDGTRIEVRGVFKESSADLSEIEGYRTFTSRNGTYTVLYLKEGRGKITIQQFFNTDDDYRAWFQQITDLDNRDREVLLNEISQNQELGSTPEERLGALAQAKTSAIIATVIAIAAAIALHLGPTSSKPIFAAVLALAPVAAWMLIQRNPLLYAILKRKKDPRADLGYLLLAAALGMDFLSSGLYFVSFNPLLVLIIPVLLVFVAVFFEAARKSATTTAAAIVAPLLLGGAYSYGLAIAADTVLDTSKASVYAVSVYGKHEHHGKSSSYYLDLAPWGPVQSEKSISVSYSTYRNTSEGDTVCLSLHPGQLHAPWYKLVDCADQPAAPNP